jgi:prefoldin subunit 5
MTENDVAKVDVNTGSLESLMAISGIGEGLAARIIASRPYASLNDLTRVQGISARSVERWAPSLAIEATDEALPVLEAEFVEEEDMVEEGIESQDEPAVETEAEVDEVQPVIEVVEEDLIPEPIPEEMDAAEPVETVQDEQPKEKVKTKKSGGSKPLLRGDAFLLGGVVGVLSVLLAVVLSLGILALVNGGLDYVSPGQLSRVQRRVETIESEMDVLTQDIAGLTTRLDSMETLGGRVADLEGTAEKLGEEAARIQAEMDGLQEAVAEISEQYGIVERFLGGMQGLLNELLPEAIPPASE